MKKRKKTFKIYILIREKENFIVKIYFKNSRKKKQKNKIIYMLQLHMNVTIILQSYKKKTDMIKFTENNVPRP